MLASQRHLVGWKEVRALGIISRVRQTAAWEDSRPVFAMGTSRRLNCARSLTVSLNVTAFTGASVLNPGPASDIHWQSFRLRRSTPTPLVTVSTDAGEVIRLRQRWSIQSEGL
jgi:hypothetical protein